MQENPERGNFAFATLVACLLGWEMAAQLDMTNQCFGSVGSNRGPATNEYCASSNNKYPGSLLFELTMARQWLKLRSHRTGAACRLGPRRSRCPDIGKSARALRLAFPAALASRWMPGLFPERTDQSKDMP
jgi:hypothetical protein